MFFGVFFCQGGRGAGERWQQAGIKKERQNNNHPCVSYLTNTKQDVTLKNVDMSPPMAHAAMGARQMALPARKARAVCCAAADHAAPPAAAGT